MPTDWTEIAELRRRLERVEPVVTEVAVMKSEMGNLTRELRANTQATHEVADQLEKVKLEPGERARGLQSAIFIAVASAVAGGLVAYIIAVATQHP